MFAPPLVMTNAVLTLPAGATTIGSVYTLSVRVSCTTDVRFSDKSIFLTASPSSTVVATILDPPTRITQDQDLRLVGSAVCTTAPLNRTLSYSWSFSSDLIAPSLLPDLTLSANLGAPANTASLVLLPNLLVPGEYRVTLLVNDPSAQNVVAGQVTQATASVLISVSAPPQPGECVLSPSAGEASTTLFTYACSGWNEPQSSNFAPFQFAIEFMDLAAPDAGWQTRTPWSSSASSSFTLSIGSFMVRALVRDTVHAVAYVDSPATVTQPAAAAADPLGFIATQLHTVLAAQLSSLECVEPMILAQQLVEQLNAVATDPAFASTALQLQIRTLYAELTSGLRDAWANCVAARVPLPVSQPVIAIAAQSIRSMVVEAERFDGITLGVATVLTHSIIGQAVLSPEPLTTASFAAFGRTSSDLMVDCAQLDFVSALVHLLLQARQRFSIAGEQVSLSEPEFDAFVQRNFVSDGSRIDLPNGQSITLTASAMTRYVQMLNTLTAANIDTSGASAAAEMDTQIVTFRLRWSGCRGDSSLSTLNSIELTFPDGTPLDFRLLGESIVFTIRLDHNATIHALSQAQASNCHGTNSSVIAENAFECSFWNTTTASYSTLGCSSLGVNLDTSTLTCSCNHLTEFAILYAAATDRLGGCAPPSTLGHFSYLIFLILYSCCASFSLRQVLRIVWHLSYWKYWLMSVEYTLIFMMCTCRALNMAIYWKLYAYLSLPVQSLLSGLPYIFIGWIFTFVITAWASIYYTSAKGQRSENPFKPYLLKFVIGNTAISGCLFFVFFGMALTTRLDRVEKLNHAGVLITVIVQLGFSVFFLLYGTLLVRSLTKDFVSPYARKLALVAVSLSTSFALSASMLLFSVSNQDLYNQNLVRYVRHVNNVRD